MSSNDWKRSFTEEDQARIAESAHAKKAKVFRGGIGFGGGDQDIQTAAASHYNARDDSHRRIDSKIDTLQQKNLNNWVKATLINSAVRAKYSILDLACGKGGDLPKWAKQEIGHYVGVDIAYKSIEHAIDRYNQTGQPSARAKCNFPSVWCAGNFVKDHFFDELEKREPGIRFDAVSCQFAIHYSWTSFKDARTALKNAAQRLKPGGLFVGTTTDANVLIKKLQHSPNLSFGNSLYHVDFMCEEGQTPDTFDKTFRGRSPFGIRYKFYLKDAVDDCEECLVHFPTFKKLAGEVGLELMEHVNLHDFLERACTKSSKQKDNIELLTRMRVLDNTNTITPDQWEVAFLYKTFVFRKKSDAPTAGSSKWRPRDQVYRKVEQKDIIVLTPDCAPEAQGIR